LLAKGFEILKPFSTTFSQDQDQDCFGTPRGALVSRTTSLLKPIKPKNFVQKTGFFQPWSRFFQPWRCDGWVV